ncbi:MAG: PKD domain-containing protein, partial [bacterium]|nr:PKD domain-containing protein [bacterium]
HLVGNDFHGWAYGGADTFDDAVIGLLSFNGNNVPGGADYKVMTDLTVTPPNISPSAIDLSRREGNYCLAPNPPITLSWVFKDEDPGDTQASYQVQVDDNSNFLSLKDDSGIVSGSAGDSSEYSPPIGKIEFDETYYWRLKVWDDKGGESDWISGTSFTTDSRWPNPDFTPNPANPKLGDEVEFTNDTTHCSPCGYSWDFGDGVSDISKNPSHIFSSVGTFIVKLTATKAGRSCVISKNLVTKMPLPTWREISPSQF